MKCRYWKDIVNFGPKNHNIKFMNKLMYRKSFIILIVIIQSMAVSAQSDYKVDTFTMVYDTLTDYKSLVKENILAQEWFFMFDKEFDLGFDFPFFDTSFDKISFSSYGLGSFDTENPG